MAVFKEELALRRRNHRRRNRAWELPHFVEEANLRDLYDNDDDDPLDLLRAISESQIDVANAILRGPGLPPALNHPEWGGFPQPSVESIAEFWQSLFETAGPQVSMLS